MSSIEQVPTRTITWVMVANPNEPCSKLIGRKELWSKDGCADWRDSDNCIIYAKLPADEADRQRILHLGHEVLHCFVGNFHGS